MKKTFTMAIHLTVRSYCMSHFDTIYNAAIQRDEASLKVLKQLCQEGISIDIQRGVYTPSMKLAEEGHANAVYFLLNHFPINVDYVFQGAVMGNRQELIAEFFNRGAHRNFALMGAAMGGFKTIETLIVNNPASYTAALFIAAKQGPDELCVAMAQTFFDSQEVFMHILAGAAMGGQVDLVNALLDHSEVKKQWLKEFLQLESFIFVFKFGYDINIRHFVVHMTARADNKVMLALLHNFDLALLKPLNFQIQTNDSLLNCFSSIEGAIAGGSYLIDFKQPLCARENSMAFNHEFYFEFRALLHNGQYAPALKLLMGSAVYSNGISPYALDAGSVNWRLREDLFKLALNKNDLFFMGLLEKIGLPPMKKEAVPRFFGQNPPVIVRLLSMCSTDLYAYFVDTLTRNTFYGKGDILPLFTQVGCLREIMHDTGANYDQALAMTMPEIQGLVARKKDLEVTSGSGQAEENISCLDDMNAIVMQYVTPLAHKDAIHLIQGKHGTFWQPQLDKNPASTEVDEEKMTSASESPHLH